MSLISRIREWFRRKPAETAPAPEEKPAAVSQRPQQTCKNCGKLFGYDPAREHVPNYCKECRKRFAQEKEEKQRAAAPHKIRRKCRGCGKYFCFPNTLEHYPNYCNDCRKRHHAEMKAKYARKDKVS